MTTFRLFDDNSPVIRMNLPRPSLLAKSLPVHHTMTNQLISQIGLDDSTDTITITPVDMGRKTVALIGESGIILNPIHPNNTQYQIMSLPVGQDDQGNNITAELTRKITRDANNAYYEQYWYNHVYGTGVNRRFLPVYYVIISSQYAKTNCISCTFTNGAVTYTHPVMCIPQSEKELYKELWNAEDNAKTVFYPTPSGGNFPTSGSVHFTGFTSY